MKCWHFLTWGGGGVWPMMTSAKKDIFCNCNKCINKRSFEFAVDLRDRQVIYQHIRFTSVVSALLKIVWLWTIHIISNYLVKENKIPPWLCKFLFLFSFPVLSMFSVGLIATKCNHKCYHISLKKAEIARVT